MENIQGLLKSLLYKTVTIYVTGDQALRFSGILFNISHHSIRLILRTEERTIYPFKPFINFNKRFPRHEILIHPGAIAEIPIDKIEAVVHFPL